MVQVRLGFNIDTRQEENEDIGCQSIDTMESLAQYSKPLTPTARQWRKAVLLAARSATEQAEQTAAEYASRPQWSDYTPTTPVARALQIAKPAVYAKVTSILATHEGRAQHLRHPGSRMVASSSGHDSCKR